MPPKRAEPPGGLTGIPLSGGRDSPAIWRFVASTGWVRRGARRLTVLRADVYADRAVGGHAADEGATALSRDTARGVPPHELPAPRRPRAVKRLMLASWRSEGTRHI